MSANKNTPLWRVWRVSSGSGNVFKNSFGGALSGEIWLKVFCFESKQILVDYMFVAVFGGLLFVLFWRLRTTIAYVLRGNFALAHFWFVLFEVVLPYTKAFSSCFLFLYELPCITQDFSFFFGVILTFIVFLRTLGFNHFLRCDLCSL